MYYIVYNLETLKVERTCSHPLPKQNERFYKTKGIAEYRGKLPMGDWFSVTNIREEIKTWKEKQIVEKLDKNGQPLVNEQGERILEEIEIEKSKTICVCDLLGHFYPEEQKVQQETKQKQAKYERLCEKYIREKYSLSDELKMSRIRDEQPEVHAEYNAYVKSCLARAKVEVYC